MGNTESTIDLRKCTIATKDEQRILLLKARQGDRKAKDKLIVCNLRFIMGVVRKYNCKFLSYNDLLHEGTLGLVKAIEMFDLERKDLTFLTYAVWWVRAFIKKAINEKDNSITIPEKAQSKATTELKSGKEDKDLTVESYKVVSVKKLVSYDSEILDNIKYSDILEDKTIESPEHSVKNEDTMRNLTKTVLDSLPDLERIILEYSFGVNKEYHTMKEITEELGITISALRDLKKQAIFRFQKNHKYKLSKEIYEDFLETAP